MQRTLGRLKSIRKSTSGGQIRPHCLLLSMAPIFAYFLDTCNTKCFSYRIINFVIYLKNYLLIITSIFIFSYKMMSISREILNDAAILYINCLRAKDPRLLNT